MKIPTTFEEKIIGAFGNEGSEWLVTLEERLASYLDKWNLTFIGPVDNLSYNYVAKVLDQNNIPLILKMGVPTFDFENEVRAIRAYEGRGFANLIKAEADNGVMLQEQIVPGTMLQKIDDEQRVLEVYTDVYTALRRPVPANTQMPTILDWAKSLQTYLNDYPDGGPIKQSYIVQAQGFFYDITYASPELELLHGDLHHQNILYSAQTGWVGIDPKGVVGDRYFDLIAFLYNELHNKPKAKQLLRQRIDFLCQRLELDRNKLLKAGYAMSLLSAVWGIDDSDDGWKETFTTAKWFHLFLNE